MALPSSSPHKRHKSLQPGQHHEHHQPLLPGLPDHLSQLCLSHLPPRLLFSVSQSWRRLLYASSYTPFLSIYTLLETNTGIEFSSYDPISATWNKVPSPPILHDILVHHPSFLSRNLPIQSTGCAGQLILLTGTNCHLLPAIASPLIFNPNTLTWTTGPKFPYPRRWCAVGSSSASVYMASGIGSYFNSDIAKSVSVFNMKRWESIAPLKDGRFSREPIDMVSSKGKLFMVNLNAKEGAIYDVKLNYWEDMKPGLVSNWTGPATSVSEEDGYIYILDEGNGVLKRYDMEDEAWTVVIESMRLKGAVGIAGGGGRVCVTCMGGGVVVVVDVKMGRMWEVSVPEGKRVIGLHVLPRMSRNCDG